MSSGFLVRIATLVTVLPSAVGKAAFPQIVIVGLEKWEARKRISTREMVGGGGRKEKKKKNQHIEYFNISHVICH